MSSSATDRVFEEHLVASLALIEAEQPRLHALLCRTFGTLEVYASVERELVRIAGTGTAIHVLPGVSMPEASTRGTIRVRSSLATIDAILAGEASLLEVVWDDRVWLAASLPELTLAHDALTLYLQAAVRCPSAPALLRRFVRAVRGERDRAVKTQAGDPSLEPQSSAA